MLAAVLMAVLLKVTQDNAYIGFSLYLFLAVAFMLFTINSVDCEDIEYERKLLKRLKARKKYYHMVA